MHEACPLITTDERVEEEARIKMMSDSVFNERMLKGVAEKIRENLDPKALIAFNKLVNQGFEFPKPERDHLNFDTPFQKWTKILVNDIVWYN